MHTNLTTAVDLCVDLVDAYNGKEGQFLVHSTVAFGSGGWSSRETKCWPVHQELCLPSAIAVFPLPLLGTNKGWNILNYHREEHKPSATNASGDWDL